MALLRGRFAQRTLAERDELEAAMEAHDRSTAMRILHSLAGNAGMFGYPALSEAARDLEQALESPRPAGDIPHKLQRVLDMILEIGLTAPKERT